MPYQLRKLSIGLGLTKEQSGQLTSIIKNTYNLFLENDASLVEINPLVVSKKSELIALDAKINIDSNALFSQSLCSEGMLSDFMQGKHKQIS